MNENMFETISINVFTIHMSNFQLCEQRKITYGSVTSNNSKLSIISYFHVVNLLFRLNKMMVNTNCEEISVQLLFQITTCDDVKCVIFCKEPCQGLMSVEIHANYRFIKRIQKTCKFIFSSHSGISSVFILFYFNIYDILLQFEKKV